MTQSTDEMIRELATNLTPVKPLGRVRDTVFAALGISLPFYGYWLITSGVRDQLRLGEAPDLVYLTVGIAQLLVAIGGLGAGLAAAVPGREDTARLGRGIFLAGLGLGILVLGTQWSAGTGVILDVSRSSLQCATAAAMLAVPSALLLARFTVRGAARHFPRSLSLACMGAIGVSSAVVHLTCSHAESIHLVLGHGFAPLAGGLVILIALTLVNVLFRLRGADQ